MSKVQQHNDLTSGLSFKRLILRKHAERYILLTLLSFALTVSLTRFFLNLTDFPQLGGGSVHISHVLWGGLFLFAAVVLVLVYINQKLFMLSAVLGGIGIGLFMDEVGKFISSDYNYFIPVAAPIIYTFFLLVVLVYLLVSRRTRRDSRLELYQLIGDFEEILDGDFSQNDMDQFNAHIASVKKDAHLAGLVPIAHALETYLSSISSGIQPTKPNPYDHFLFKWISFRDRALPRRRVKSLIIGGLFGLAAWELFYPANLILKLGTIDQLINAFSALITSQLVTGPLTTFLFLVRLSFNLVLGLLLLSAAILFLFNRERNASVIAYITLLVLLTSENLLLFYFDQFSTILNAVLQFILLLFVIHYRREYLKIGI